MIFVDNVKIGKDIYLSMQDNGIVTATDSTRKPFFVFDLSKQKPLFGNVRKAKKQLFVSDWLCAFLSGKREIVYSNGTIFAVKNGRLGFYKLQNIA